MTVPGAGTAGLWKRRLTGLPETAGAATVMLMSGKGKRTGGKEAGAKAHFGLEREALGEGLAPVCGIDEAGRGPLAGPVVAACVVLDGRDIPPGIDDSKKLSEAAREALHEEIMARARVGVGIAGVEVIERLNILGATMWAMARALEELPGEPPKLALVDGNRAPDLPCRCRTVIGGDATSVSIAAASIIAKVTRDRIMRRLDEQYPGYGFAAHKGYPVAAHREALMRLGPCPQHRRCYKPVREALAALEERRGR